MARIHCFIALALLAPRLLLADAAADWQAIVALDAGPRIQARSEEELAGAVREHLRKQETALRAFLAQHPGDPRTFEARVRLARLLRSRGEMEHSEPARAESKRILDELEKTATRDQRAEIDFIRITSFMRGLRAPTKDQRDYLLGIARKFQTAHPADRRVAPLLAEVATLFDAQPKTKRRLLADALALATDDELRGRVADDLKRLDLLGNEVPLRFTTADGKAVDAADHRGKVIIVVFFASWSPPSTAALATVQRAIGALPKDRAQILGVSLDNKPEQLAAVVKQHGVTWPVAFDGQGWESPLVRSLGINALPTVWLLDKQGRLRSLNALDGLAGQARQLIDERAQ